MKIKVKLSRKQKKEEGENQSTVCVGGSEHTCTQIFLMNPVKQVDTNKNIFS